MNGAHHHVASMLNRLRRKWRALGGVVVAVFLIPFSAFQLYSAATAGTVLFGSRTHSSWHTYEGDPFGFVVGVGLWTASLILSGVLLYKTMRQIIDRAG
jgi:hypothetical protein